ncbi:MAG: glycosyltransferase family 25 protein [Methylococcales symbiont of Hymedesmia sp. n. MRB-2018]|nr:MAG: glycosyltransferase family 25 protein [Methylococcales symbiont of Hymedesmia sp. n. MRB-2018]
MQKIKIPIFIINLKKQLNKKQHMEELCEKYNLAVEFIDAVDGRLLSATEINSVYSEEQAMKNLRRPMTKGEIGCALSHKLIYQKMIDDDIETALIFEDDIQFDNALLSCLAEIDKLPKNWELMLLGHRGSSGYIQAKYSFWYSKKLNQTHRIRRLAEAAYGSHGYYLNNRGARKLVQCLQLISRPIDHFTGVDKYVNSYAVQNPVIVSDEILVQMSTIHADREEICKRYSFSRPETLSGKLIRLTYLFVLKFGETLGTKQMIGSATIFWKRIKPLRRYF